MCDQDHYDDDLKDYTARGAVSRRQFGALSIGAGMMALLPRAANAQSVTERDVTIKTPDGTADCLLRSSSERRARRRARVARHPRACVPAFRQMGKRLAESGYTVLTVNPFYRMKPSPVVPGGRQLCRS